jgi:hypothetical protein
VLDHTGQRRVLLEDAFRALGSYHDTNRFTYIVMGETPEGALIREPVFGDALGG